jgi:hypothetical protein
VAVVTTIYLVSDGEYSDYSVLGVYSTMEKAEYARKLYAATNGIDEIELDHIPPHPPGELRWVVRILDDGEVKGVFQTTPDEDEYHPVMSTREKYWGGEIKPGRVFQLWARDSAHAIKIATEKRREMLAMGTWNDD